MHCLVPDGTYITRNKYTVTVVPWFMFMFGRFVDVDGIVDYHCVIFLLVIKFI
jgi:hypothetical protein